MEDILGPIFLTFYDCVWLLGNARRRAVLEHEHRVSSDRHRHAGHGALRRRSGGNRQTGAADAMQKGVHQCGCGCFFVVVMVE